MRIDRDQFPEYEADLPEWAKAPFRDLLSFLKVFMDTLHVTIAGVTMVRDTPTLIEEMDLHVKDQDMVGDDLRRQAELANREASSGFPLVHGQAVVILWATLEELVRAFISAYIANTPAIYGSDPFRRMKVPLGEYESLPVEDRPWYVIDALERSVNSPLKKGVGRFDALLDPLGFHVDIDEHKRRTLYELHQVRNAIVHRRGIVDKRLLDSCPWLNMEKDKGIMISHEKFHEYFQALGKFVGALHRRVKAVLRPANSKSAE